MWWRRRKRSDKINPKSVELIDMIATLLTPEELKYFYFEMDGEKYDFRERMMFRYGYWRPIYSLEVSRRKARRIVRNHRAVIVPNPELHTIFLDKFENILFREF